MDLRDPLLERIEFALDLYRVSATRFGYVVAGDPALVTKMRRGRLVKSMPLRTKIVAALDRIEKEGDL